MDSYQRRDSINFKNDKEFEKIVGDQDNFLWAGEIIKVNVNKKRQTRNFLVSKDFIYNMASYKWKLVNLFKGRIRRKIKLEAIKEITYSMSSNSFVIHIPNEYDYFLISDLRDQFIEAILYGLIFKDIKEMPIYFVDDIDLAKYNKYEKEEPKSRPPTVPTKFDHSSFQKFYQKNKQEYLETIEKTEVIFSKAAERVTQDNFEIITPLSSGHFAKVFLVEKKDTRDLYALKVINKMDIIKRNFFENLRNEKKVMEKIENKFVVNLEYCFSSPQYVFFAMKFKQGGEIYYHLRKRIRFSEDIAKFYAAQIISGLIYLHSHDIIYRDMKPENVLLDEKGNACLADFGISKVLNKDQVALSFVGTPEYIAPEVILQKGYTRTVDIWCFGVLLYEMIYGIPPFFNRNHKIMMTWILKMNPIFPAEIQTSTEIKDLISKVI